MKKTGNINSGDNMDPEAGGGRRRLKTMPDLRRFLAAVVNQLDAGKITEGRARTFGYLAATMSSIIERSDLELRLTAIEEKLERQEKNGN